MKKTLKVRVGVVALVAAAMGGAIAAPALASSHHSHAHIRPAVAPSH